MTISHIYICTVYIFADLNLNVLPLKHNAKKNFILFMLNILSF